jgi:Tc5 transposase DNA-binding domain
LCEKAKFFYRNITGKDDFQASAGWLQKFKKRFGIRQLTVCGESLSSDLDAVVPFIEKLRKIIQERNLTPDQVYNADESGLFWRVLPSKTLAHSGEKSASGMKISKERITFECFWKS